MSTLERLAKLATPGSWVIEPSTEYDAPIVAISGPELDGCEPEDAALIVACSPPRILSLIARLRAAEAERDELKCVAVESQNEARKCLDLLDGNKALQVIIGQRDCLAERVQELEGERERTFREAARIVRESEAGSARARRQPKGEQSTEFAMWYYSADLAARLELEANAAALLPEPERGGGGEE